MMPLLCMCRSLAPPVYEHLTCTSMRVVIYSSLNLTDTQPEPPKVPTDIAAIPDELAVDPDDKLTPQSDILNEIIGSAVDSNLEDKFVYMVPHTLKLSKLKAMYKSGDENVVSLLKHRNRIHIDDEFTLEMGLGKIRMDTRSSMIDYHLTVGNCMGFSPLLPNARSDPYFCFKMDLKMPCRDFKGKNGMLGFFPAGKMLYVGRCRNEDVYLAMAPNKFLRGYFTPVRAGYSTGESVMSTRHYRQTVIMIAHFLELVPSLHSSTWRTGMTRAWTLPPPTLLGSRDLCKSISSLHYPRVPRFHRACRGNLSAEIRNVHSHPTVYLTHYT